MASSSSSSAAARSSQLTGSKYDVFLSFRGEDTRRTFIDHLYQGLENRKIFTNQDDKRLVDGDSQEELLKAIEESQVAVIIFSKNYATSRWCLDELVKIMECKLKNGQLVIPVFYEVYPSEVRHQTESFAEAFAKHESRYKDDVEGMQKVQGWRTALSAAVNLKGYIVYGGIGSDCIGELVDDVSSKLCKTSSSYLQDIVGIDIHLEKVKSLLEMETNDVRILGIWGMGGVGKTTLARAVFDTLSPQFQGASFLADVKETNTNEMHSLQNILLSQLLRKDKKYVYDKEEGKHLMAHRLRFMKVLVVLDDINHHDHLEYLAGDLGWFGNGSRIVATTRDKQVIGKNNVVYEVTTLPEHDAIQLFNHYAFKDETPDEHIKKLALEVVSHAKGLPLALRLWGILLYNKDKTKWREVVDLIKGESSPDVVKKLKISFEGLQDKEKMIFLDIACFFRGMRKDETIEILESYDLGARIRLHDLIEKSLVFITKYDTIQMHDLIQDMGRYVVKMQNDSRKPSRLWNIKDFKNVMVNNTGTMAVEAIWFTYSEKLCFSKDAMKNMQSLRILGIFHKDGSYRMPYFNNPDSNCQDGSIEYLPNNLCWFVWHEYPWKLLPENFNPKRLVHLDLRWSSLHYLWNETKLPQFPSLRRINLSGSKSLKRTPDFKGMPNLEYLTLEKCRSLEEVHHSLKNCKKLMQLNLSYCTKLERFPYVNVESLESLNLKYCYSLEIFPEILGIREVPSLPSSICKSKGLVKLNVSYCSILESLPEEIGCLSSLEELYLKGNNFKHFPRSISKLRALEYLDLSDCKRLTQLPKDIGLLSSLKHLNLSGNHFEHLPRSISELRALEYLDLSDCKRLTQLPEDIGWLSSLKHLNLSGNHFEHLPRSISELRALEYLDLSDCKRLTQLPKDIGLLSSLKHLNLSGNHFEHLPRSISELRALEYLDLSDCKRLTQLPEFPQQLDTINADWSNDSICNSLFQNNSSLQHDIHSLSLRVFVSLEEDIPSWFNYQGMGTSVSVNLPKNWYVSYNFFGFAVCYCGNLSNIIVDLIPLCDDGMSSMTQEFALSNNSEYSNEWGINFLLVPLGGLWDASMANGKTPNDYGCIKLDFIGETYDDFGETDDDFGEEKKFGFRLLYKDEPKLGGLLQMRENNESMASSSSSARSLQLPQWKYDVFLSFRGEDTHITFMGHLYQGLRNRGIFTFQGDKRLERGDSIQEELLKAIKESQVALIVFSKKYATSRWCLNELLKIMECKEKNGQTVIPVFYDVDPSHVQNQRESFAEAFARHESKYKDDAEGMQKVKGWRNALTAAADLKGFDIRNGIESENIQQIVDHISSKLCNSAYSLSSLKDVVGIHAHFEKLKSQLEVEIDDVRIVGIWGTGGIGKTTIAKAIFHTLSYQFKAACFLEDVKENAKKNQLHYLQNTLLSELLGETDDYVNNKNDGKSMIPSRLSSMKVLIVLDDIDERDHLEYLAGDVGWFGDGSRVVVTTRNKDLIEKDAAAIYEVPTLPNFEALQLFNQYAFRKEVPDERFKNSWEVVHHAKGLPLVLKVWGSLLHGKDLIEWRRIIDYIKKNYSSDIVQKLKISYDGLEPIEQQIFLDIACFFRGDEKKKVMQILESCDFGADGLDVLIDKSLVFLTEDDTIEMHDLIQDMGKYIVKIQKDAGKCSRIWDYEDFKEMMDNNKGTKEMEAIWFHYDGEICFSKKAMKNMEILRILYIWSQDCSLCHDGSIEYLPNSLRWFVWNHFPWESLPENFEPRRLVHLQLRFSSLHYLWTGIKRFPYLRTLDLSRSRDLTQTPDFTLMSNLEYLDLSNCINLEEVHYSLGCCTKLKRLNLIYCRRLKRFPFVNVESLEYLDLKFCSRLEKFPEIHGRTSPNLKIKMCDSEIRELPSYIVQCLTLRHLESLVALPRSIGMLQGLVILDVSNCYTLESLPYDLGDLVNLEKVDASGTLISRPPSSIFRLNKLTFMSFAKQRYNVSLEDGVHFVFPLVYIGLRSLEDLDLSYCNLIDGGLPEEIGSLSSLKELNFTGNNFQHLPGSIARLGALRSLDLKECKMLKELPDFMGMPNLMTLNLSILNIEHLPQSIEQLGALRSLDLSYCERLKELPSFMGMQNLETLNLSNCINLEEVHCSLGLLKKLCTLKMTNCKQLKRFPALCIDSLVYLCLRDCSSLEKIPEILGNMKAELEIHMLDSVIRALGFRGFENLATLPSSICKLKSLVSLNVSDCSKLKIFPEEMGDLENLENLDARGTLISQPPSSIVQLNKLKFLSFAKQNSGRGLVDGVYFVFPQVNKGLLSLEHLDLSYCNLIDGGLPEDIGCLHSLKELYLCGNNFEHLPQSVAQLGALRFLDLSDCKRLKELPGFTGIPNLETLDLSNCMNLEEVHLSLGFLRKLCSLKLTNCERLKSFPVLCIDSLEYLNLEGCSSLQNFPEILGSMNLKLKSGIRCLDLRGLENLVTLPSTICKLKNLVELNVSACSKLESLPKEMGDLENLEWLDAKDTLISQPPRSIVHLNKLHFLRFAKQKSEVGLEDGVCFVFPSVSDGLRLLEIMNLSYCNLIDGGLPEDIGFLSSLNELCLCGNNFEHLPQSIAQLGALRSLDLSYCKRLKELPGFGGMQNLETLNLSNCMNLEEVHHSLGCLKKLCTLKLTNCKRLKRFPVLCIDSLEYLNLEGCSSLENFPEILGSMKVKSDIHMLDSVMRDLNSMYISLPRSLSQDIVSLPNAISASDPLSQRVFTIVHCGNKIPSWFHHQGMDESVSIDLPENWYVSDNFLGFAVCYSGNLIDITVDLIPSCDDRMTQKLELSTLPNYDSESSSGLECDTESTIHFFLVPLAVLWETSKANGKTPNDYGLIKLLFSGEMEEFGFRLLYKDEPTEHCIGTKRNRYDSSEHHDEASCSSSKKQRSHF